MKLKEFFIDHVNDKSEIHYSESQDKYFLTYKEMLQKAMVLSKEIEPLDRKIPLLCLIWMDNSVAAYVSFMAIKLAGGIPIPIHAYTSFIEYERIISHLDPDLIFLSDTQAKLVESRDVSTLTLISKSDVTIYKREKIGSYQPPSKTGVIFMSSGSTGVPKGIMLSDENILSNVRSIQNYVQLTRDDKVILLKSIGYASTVTGEWLTALFAGCDIEIHNNILKHPLDFVRSVSMSNATFVCTVPSVLIPLVKMKKHRLLGRTNIRQIMIVGGPLPGEILELLCSDLPRLSFIPSYGLTEASPRVSYLPKEMLFKSESVGIPIQDVEVKIYRDEQELPPFEEGDIVVSGPNVMLGYFKDPERTEKTLTSYGLLTSDIGYKDGDGALYITGRKDNALNVGGHTIYPERIEKIMIEHLPLKEVAVTGVEDVIWGQRIFAFIVRIEDSTLYEFDERCKQILQATERPRDFIEVDHLPRTLNGKIDRKALRNLAKEHTYVNSLS
ncbi:class I adenylate-forming enzyme family protein [Fictibacillus norfolkensis]|uniref:Acyl--CoA ligase n=1 Tax=Fictibacillus norfolkensis TaxID=2762233 RepID=A0ABR8SH93_9BACL|nr:class I adenylate-forming enzyme family protein [Fictibacillus norfolkensis]MBD7962758.1 acyl--CoA ligase [Fictibacillus norfolkensis]